MAKVLGSLQYYHENIRKYIFLFYKKVNVLSEFNKSIGSGPKKQTPMIYDSLNQWND